MFSRTEALLMSNWNPSLHLKVLQIAGWLNEIRSREEYAMRWAVALWNRFYLENYQAPFPASRASDFKLTVT